MSDLFPIYFPEIRLITIAPGLIICISGLAVLTLGSISKRERGSDLAYLSLIGVALSFILTLMMWGMRESAFADMIVLDNFSLFFYLIFLISTGITILISINYMNLEEMQHYEYYVLILFSTFGMMLMVTGKDLIIIFLGLETMSISIYILAGYIRTNIKSNESALKYFLLGAFSSAFFLYGIALLYGATGTTNLARMAEFLSKEAEPVSKMLMLGAGLLIVGFGFKVGSVPFHMWTPDVYEGAPAPVTAFMSVGVKAAAFAAFLRVFFTGLPNMQQDWTMLLYILAVLTMVIGNLVALVQSNIKRMLAYSSIAHAGYILVAMVAGNDLGNASILYYFLAYTFMNLGAFGVVVLYGRKGEENVYIDNYKGLGFKHPILGAAMAIFMFSLAGIPPTAGFVGKFYIFSAAIKAGYIWLAVIGVLTSAISVFYYFRITINMYMHAPGREVEGLVFKPSMVIALIITAVGTLYLGIFPSTYLQMAKESILLLF